MENYVTGKFITEDGLKNIKNHKYKSGGYSMLDNVMNPFWELVVKLMPMTLAPNMITLLGVIINFALYFAMFYFDRSLTAEVPSWTYFGFGIGLFVYQTLDAIDGKQARRTGSSSPLGQLFDHGCDCLSTTLVALALVHTLKLGVTWQSKLLIGSLWLPFYLAQLLEYHVGLVRTNVGVIGVTEGQLAQCAVMAVAGFTKGEVFEITFVSFLPVLEGVIPAWLNICHAIVGFTVISSIVFAGYLVIEMVVQKETIKGKLYALWGMNPIILMLINLYLIDENDPFVSKNAAVVILVVSVIFTLVTTKVIISSMALMHVRSFQLEPFLFAGYYYFHYLGPNSFPEAKAAEYAYYCLIATFVISIILYFRFVRVCITQITAHLGIYCFSIKKRKED
ncbi:unnamed protein product [Moneuplotes crassus]|uniref:Uncharacterized protein n=1 Tax=Euplotes crassus TaxID=5936 RepID=A0AAD1XF23_EUPCR|nr:unnamed protein product [Moneuplotes crassus]